MKYENLEPLLNNVLEIKSNNKIWELHNDSDFEEVQYNVEEKTAKLIWNYPSDWFRKESHFNSNEEYIEEHNIQSNDYKITLVFISVSVFEVRSRDINIPFREETCLTDIRNFYEDDNGNLYEDGSITFIFESGLQVRVKCESIKFETILL